MAIESMYRDHRISFVEFNEEWECQDFGFSDKSLKKLQEKINAQIKKDSEFTKMPAIYVGSDSWHGKKMGQAVIITSVSEDGSVWISHNKTREKMYKSDKKYLAVSNEDTITRISQIKEIEREILILKENQAVILSTIKRVFKEEVA